MLDQIESLHGVLMTAQTTDQQLEKRNHNVLLSCNYNKCNVLLQNYHCKIERNSNNKIMKQDTLGEFPPPTTRTAG